MDLITMGSIIIDTALVSESINSLGKQFYIKKGSKIEVDKLQFNFGGSAHNIAYGTSKLGLKTGIIGSVGYDSFGKSILERLKKEKINTKLVKKVSTKMTGYSTVLIGPDGDRTIMVYRGANDIIDPSDIKLNYFKDSKAFLFTAITGEKSLKALKKAIRYAKKKKLTVIANPSINMIRERKDELSDFLKKVDVVILNAEEALKFSRSKSISAALDKLIVGQELVVVTLGKRGSIAFDGTKKYKQKAFKSRIVDTTGAGDAFTSGFLRCYLKKLPIPYCLKFGAATSSSIMKTYGATNDFPSKNNIIKLVGGG